MTIRISLYLFFFSIYLRLTIYLSFNFKPFSIFLSLFIDQTYQSKSKFSYPTMPIYLIYLSIFFSLSLSHSLNLTLLLILSFILSIYQDHSTMRISVYPSIYSIYNRLLIFFLLSLSHIYLYLFTYQTDHSILHFVSYPIMSI